VLKRKKTLTDGGGEVEDSMTLGFTGRIDFKGQVPCSLSSTKYQTCIWGIGKKEEDGS